MHSIKLRQITWVGASLHDLKSFPEYVQKEIGFSLYRAQEGKMPHNAKFLKGLDPGIIEIVSDYNKNTYRAVYAVKLGEDLYVLHVFQKKSKTGIKTPKQDINLIKKRLTIAKEDAKKRVSEI